MSNSRSLDVVVVGASFAGMLTAAAVAAHGHRVLILERDRLPGSPGPRRGVPQSVQPHVLLHRGLLAMERLLPGLRTDLIGAGALAYDSGRIAYRSPYGWLPERSSYEVLAATRPLVESVVRRRVTALPGVTLLDGVTLHGLRRVGRSWLLVGADGPVTSADLVVDASGRGSRLPYWLADLGLAVPPPEVVNASLGYASRRFRADRPLPVTTGVAVSGSLDSGRSGLALRVEDDHWLVLAAGYGEDRPSRLNADLRPFLASLLDPALVELVDLLTPVSDVAVHRQAGNRRYAYEKAPVWPDGLLAVGDSACSFNPILGQGITVAACQAEVLLDGLGSYGRRPPGRELQARLAAVARFPWSVATSEDLRQARRGRTPTVPERLGDALGTRLAEVAVAGDQRVIDVFSDVYHLMASPVSLLSPDLAARLAWSLVAGVGEPSPRPAEVNALGRLAAAA